MSKQVSHEQVYEYFLKFLNAGNFPSVAFAARRFGVSVDTIRVKVRRLVSEGKLVKYKFNYYLPGDKRLEFKNAPKIKRVLSPEARKKMSTAGTAGAEALKRYAFENGKERFVVGSNRGEEELQNIEAVARKAEAAGTLNHPRPVYVVLMGEKVG